MAHTYEELVARSEHIRKAKVLHTGDGGKLISVAFSPDGRWLAGSPDGSKHIYLWDLQDGTQSLLTSELNNSSRSFQVVFSPDGHWLASAWNDGTIWLCDLANNNQSQILTGHTDQVVSVDFSPHSPFGPSWLIALGNSGQPQMPAKNTRQVMSVDFSPDGRLLASSSYNETVQLGKVENGNNIQILTGHTDIINSVAFSPSGALLASGSKDETVRIWEVATGQILRVLKQRSYIYNLAISPNGRWLTCGGAERTLQVWDMETWEEQMSAPGPPQLYSSICGLFWSPDSNLFFSYLYGGAVELWHIPSGLLISTLPQQAESTWIRAPLAISPDGRLLATYADTTSAIQLWDISALDVGPQSSTIQKKRPAVITTELQMPVRTHLRTLPFCHVVAPDVPLTRAASWMQGAAAAGWPLPLALAHDLGLLLSQPAAQRSLHKPDYLPFEEDTSAYLAALQRLAEHPPVRDLPSWQPPLSDVVLSVLIARLVEGLELPDAYRPPTGAEGVRFVRALESRLVEAQPAELWSRTPADERAVWRTLLSAKNIARLEKNLLAVKQEELRFLALYGAPLSGTPDPRELLDLLALTGLPPTALQALSQMLNLLPHVSDVQASGGLQTYPEGGYEGLALQGSLDSILPTETAYPHNVFLHRVLNHEALYYGRERQREQRRELVYIVAQVGWGLGGDGQVLVRALLLALNQIMQTRGYDVLYSFAGTTLTEPRPLDKPGEISRVLYYQERAAVASEQVLQGVLQHLHSWRETYHRRLVFWVVSDTFDADEATTHEASYKTLQAESEQHAWYVRVGPVQSERAKRAVPPVTAHYFERWQVMESGLLWAEQRAGRA